MLNYKSFKQRFNEIYKWKNFYITKHIFIRNKGDDLNLNIQELDPKQLKIAKQNIKNIMDLTYEDANIDGDVVESESYKIFMDTRLLKYVKKDSIKKIMVSSVAVKIVTDEFDYYALKLRKNLKREK